MKMGFHSYDNILKSVVSHLELRGGRDLLVDAVLDPQLGLLQPAQILVGDLKVCKKVLNS